jgi:TrpR-related protein YerC/YecD
MELAVDKSFFAALAAIGTVDTAERFMRDLCTPAELKAMAERWRVCRLLWDGKLSYREISTATGVSTATICRVARCLNDESCGGYRTVLKRFSGECAK